MRTGSPALDDVDRFSARPGEPNQPGPVLIVDDDFDVREALADLLVDEGLSVVTAADGAEAIKLLRTLHVPPSIILLDLMMPVMNGYAFLEEQRRDPALSSIPVAVITAGHGVDRARLGNSITVVSKPFKSLQLTAILGTLPRS
jgi:CheY-like chemotaxis protein